MKFTNYYLHARLRPDRIIIKHEWIEQVFYHYEFEMKQADNRLRRWGFIKEVNKYLRLVVLEDGETIHNAFFDRSYTKLV